MAGLLSLAVTVTWLAGALSVIREPTAMVVEGTAITMDDPRAKDEYTWGPSVGIFVEVHVRNPRIGAEPTEL